MRARHARSVAGLVQRPIVPAIELEAAFGHQHIDGPALPRAGLEADVMLNQYAQVFFDGVTDPRDRKIDVAI